MLPQMVEAEPRTAAIYAPEFWINFLPEKHPEVLRIEIGTYPQAPHGQAVEATRELMPVIPGFLPLADESKPGEVMAIGCLVDVCAEAGCDHRPPKHAGVLEWYWEQWQDGSRPMLENPKGFIFLDIEFCGPETLERLVQTTLAMWPGR